MSKFKFLVSFAFVLCLVLAMGTCAFAEDVTPDITVDTPEFSGDIPHDIISGVTVGINNGFVDWNHGIVKTNNNIVASNYNTVGTNNGTVKYNDALGTVTSNNKIVVENRGTIEHNYGTVEENYSLVTNNHGKVIYPATDSCQPWVINNYGEVKGNDKAYTGEIIYNFGGTYSDVTVGFNYYSITSNFSVAELKPLLTASGNVTPYTSNITYEDYTAKLLADSPSSPVLFYVLQGADLAVQIPADYTLKINGESATADNSGKAIVKNVDKNIHLEFTPVPKPVSSVPATADNSNMPLWGALFISFAALAMLTRKKKA